MSTTAVTPDTSSSAVSVETVEAPEVSVQDRLNHASSAELDTWRRTGDIPPVKVTPAVETPAEKKDEPVSARTGASATPEKEQQGNEKKDKPAESRAAADAAGPQPATPSQRRNKADARFEKLLDAWEKDRNELNRLRSQPSGLTADKQESQPATEGKDGKSATAAPAAFPPRPKLTDTDPKTGKPFTTLDAWGDAVDEWNDKRLEAKLSERLGKVEQERTVSEQERQIADEIVRKSQPAMEKYKDFLEVVADTKMPIPAGSPVDLFIKDSDNPGEVLYYIGKHPEVLEEFYGFHYDPALKTWDYKGWDFKKPGSYNHVLSPIRQVKRLEAIERELSGTAASPKPALAAEPRPVNLVPPKLPPPPTELDGRRAAPVDEAEAALARGDTAGYMRAVNAREMKASRR